MSEVSFSRWSDLCVVSLLVDFWLLARGTFSLFSLALAFVA